MPCPKSIQRSVLREYPVGDGVARRKSTREELGTGINSLYRKKSGTSSWSAIFFRNVAFLAGGVSRKWANSLGVMPSRELSCACVRPRALRRRLTLSFSGILHLRGSL